MKGRAMSIGSEDYHRVDDILRILYQKEIGINPMDHSHVVRSPTEMIRNKAVNVAFWIKFDNHTNELTSESMALSALATNGRDQMARVIPDELRPSVAAELTRIRWPKRLVGPDDKCDECGKLGCTQRCAACNYSCYCSKECQRDNWRKEHKKLCKFLQKYYKPVSERAVNVSINHKLQLAVGKILR
jgi:MYND finger